ncbi:MAG TPA: hypothetical protein DIT97_28490, partial [Gimesia maris]|nr:hypothetical protein [Gimesia maris]
MQDVTIKEAPAEFPFSKSVQMLDLTDVRQRLKISSNLTEKEIIRAELEYRLFLALNQVKGNRATPTTPTELADRFWHEHIIDTRRYTADCQSLFGYFLHHIPEDALPEGCCLKEVACNTFAIMRHRFGYGRIAGGPEV